MNINHLPSHTGIIRNPLTKLPNQIDYLPLLKIHLILIQLTRFHLLRLHLQTNPQLISLFPSHRQCIIFSQGSGVQLKSAVALVGLVEVEGEVFHPRGVYLQEVVLGGGYVGGECVDGVEVFE